jgi:hypothetical protein
MILSLEKSYSDDTIHHRKEIHTHTQHLSQCRKWDCNVSLKVSHKYKLRPFSASVAVYRLFIKRFLLVNAMTLKYKDLIYILY